MSQDIFHSPCCQAEIVDRKYNAHCSKCDKIISWAFANEEWARHEACGVFLSTDGKKYFAWQQVSSLENAKSLLDRGDPFVCFSESCIGSIAANYNRDGDLIPIETHRSWIKRWMSQVENPEIGAVILQS